MPIASCAANSSTNYTVGSTSVKLLAKKINPWSSRQSTPACATYTLLTKAIKIDLNFAELWGERDKPKLSVIVEKRRKDDRSPQLTSKRKRSHFASIHQISFVWDSVFKSTLDELDVVSVNMIHSIAFKLIEVHTSLLLAFNGPHHHTSLATET